MNNIKTRCPEGLFKEPEGLLEEIIYGLFRRLKGLDRDVLNDFFEENVYHNIPKENLKARYSCAYNFLNQITGVKIIPSPKNPEKIKRVTKKTLGRLEEDIASVLRINEGKYCSFD